MELDIHQAALIFPEMDAASFEALKADIKAHGQREQVTIHEGKILDGRHRYRACKELGKKVLTEIWDGADPVAYVLSKNLHRRHLTTSQRAMVAAKIANMPRGGDGSNQYQRGANRSIDRLAQDPISNAEAAEKMKVSEPTVRRAKQVLRHGSEELVKAVEDGKVPVHAAREVLSLPKEEQLGEAKKKPTRNGTGREGGEEDPRVQGKGIFLAHEAINCLKRIPQNDALRERGFQLVKDWIRHNR